MTKYKYFFPLLFIVSFLLASCNKDTIVNTIYPHVNITSITPNNGATQTVITIIGSNFSPFANDNKVTINGVPLIIKSATTDTIRAIITDGVKTGRVVVSTNTLPDFYGPVFTRTHNTDYYFAGIDNNLPVYWKNGIEYFLPIRDASGYVASMSILGNDIYMAGRDGSNAALWINGVEVNLPLITNNASFVSRIKIIGSDVYLIGGDGNGPAYWKNGQENILNIGSGGYVISMAILGTDVYFTGSDGFFAAYWKNGVEQILPSPIANSSSLWSWAGDIEISGSDVYICGLDGYKAVYWKNGLENLLPFISPSVRGSEAAKILINNNDIYFAGFDGDNIVYWKNNIEYTLPSSTGSDGEIGTIMAYGSDIYFSGDEVVTPAYWKNGIETILPKTGFNASAGTMLIVPN